jgi:cytochrome c oxidase cbb3-type subunit I/II
MEATAIKQNALDQGYQIAKDLNASGVVARPDSEMVAVIAYLQKLGQYDQVKTEEHLNKQKFGIPPPGKPGIPDTLRSSQVSSN